MSRALDDSCRRGDGCTCRSREEAWVCPSFRPSTARDPRERDPKYLGWIASLPCIAHLVRTGQLKRGVQVAHIRASYPEEGWREVGKGEKPHDWRTAPLCVDCHLNGRHAQHATNEGEWWRALGIYPPHLVAALREAYAAGQSGYAVIARFAAAASNTRAAHGS